MGADRCITSHALQLLRPFIIYKKCGYEEPTTALILIRTIRHVERVSVLRLLGGLCTWAFLVACGKYSSAGCRDHNNNFGCRACNRIDCVVGIVSNTFVGFAGLASWPFAA